ncbi:histidine phosphatase family protein [Patescibacteria group bacterium]|nr:histidine phosphatase family protein [Patescibacteria group bacterium]MCL5114635.1 histidine phosphatase family protein [Patescibacteria group bacterium]
MLKIYLARHGQDKDNAAGILNGRRDELLTELGWEQARTLAAEIKSANLSFDAVYTSPLKRAETTARTVTDALGVAPPIVMPNLIERNFGIMTGKLVKDIAALCAPNIIQADIITYFLSPKGAETFPDLIERGKKVIEEVQHRHKDGNILLVGHGDMGKMIYAAYYHLDWRSVLTMFHFGNSELLLLSEDSPSDAAHVFTFKQFNH